MINAMMDNEVLPYSFNILHMLAKIVANAISLFSIKTATDVTSQRHRQSSSDLIVPFPLAFWT